MMADSRPLAGSVSWPGVASRKGAFGSRVPRMVTYRWAIATTHVVGNRAALNRKQPDSFSQAAKRARSRVLVLAGSGATSTTLREDLNLVLAGREAKCSSCCAKT